ncbi:MAG: hypothetical protein WCE69_00180 [Aestuariivirga sp.]
MRDAIVNALGTIAAAFVGVVTWYLASRNDRQREVAEREAQRHAEERLRDQRVLDIVVALHSEILAGIVANRRQLTKEDAEYAMAQKTPFATADDTDFVFDSVKADLSILPAEVIHSVVQYYRTAKQSNLLTADLRDPYFLKQTPSEKRRIIGHLLQIVETQKILGEAALTDLSAFASNQGLDLRENEIRAGKLLSRARAEMKLIFKKSVRSVLPSKPPENLKRKLS